MSVVSFEGVVARDAVRALTAAPEAVTAVAEELAIQGKRLRAAVILGGFLAERSQSPMSYSQMVAKAAALAEALDREVRS